MSNRHYCIIGDHSPGKGVRNDMWQWVKAPVTYRNGAWHYNEDSSTTIECCPRHRPVGYTISPDLVHKAFDKTADAISGDLFRLSKDDVGEFQLDRETVADYLQIHGSEEVSLWYYSLSPSERDQELDRIGVPRYWTE